MNQYDIAIFLRRDIQSHLKNVFSMLESLPIEITHEILVLVEARKLALIWNDFPEWRYLMSNNFWVIKVTRDRFFTIHKSLTWRTCVREMGYKQGIIKYHRALDDCFKNNRCEKIELDYEISSVYYSDEEVLVTNDVSNTRRTLIINSSTGTIQDTVTMEENHFVLAFRKFDDLLVYLIRDSIFNRNHLKVWNIRTQVYELDRFFSLKNILRESGRIISFSKNRIVTILGRQSVLSVLNIDNQVALEYQDRFVRHAISFGKNIVLQMWSGELKIFYFNDQSLVTLTNNAEEFPRKILRISGYLICYCFGHRVVTWDVDTLSQICSFTTIGMSHKSPIIYFYDTFSIYCFGERNFQVWNFQKGVKILDFQNVILGSEVFVQEPYIFIADYNNYSIKVWKYSGEYLTSLHLWGYYFFKFVTTTKFIVREPRPNGWRYFILNFENERFRNRFRGN